MTERTDRYISNRFVRNFMLAVEENMGSYSLRMMLHQSGLDRYIPQIPPANNHQEIKASEFAAFQKCLRDYYGTGARGSLFRIGQRTLDLTIKSAGAFQKARFTAARMMPTEARRRLYLDFVAAILQKEERSDSVYTLDRDIIFVDTASLATLNQKEMMPICWATLGMIHEAIIMATGEEMDISEIACRAKGDDACQFKISQARSEKD